MTEHGNELDAARAAKKKVKALLPKGLHFSGIGLTERHGHYCVKVNLESEPEVDLPEEVDGVPIVFHVVGEIHKQH